MYFRSYYFYIQYISLAFIYCVCTLVKFLIYFFGCNSVEIFFFNIDMLLRLKPDICVGVFCFFHPPKKTVMRRNSNFYFQVEWKVAFKKQEDRWYSDRYKLVIKTARIMIIAAIFTQRNIYLPVSKKSYSSKS
jgi:hypothetical protein